MSVNAAVEAEEKTAARYAHPVVNGFYGHAIQALDQAPDGASAAVEITAEFQRHHTNAARQITALTGDVRRISADDASKAAMLTHAGRYAGRMLEENLRLVGQLHGHQEAEARLADLAGQLDATVPAVAEQIREILGAVAVPAPVASGTVVLASQTDARWQVGWFGAESQKDGPLKPLPFVGWVLTAEAPGAPAQGVEAAFTLNGTWYTKGELAQRGMYLRRMD